MADQKDKAQEKKKQEETSGGDKDNEQTSGYGSTGGNMGAGKSGKEAMGSEKPSDGEGMGSHKPGGSTSQQQGRLCITSVINCGILGRARACGRGFFPSLAAGVGNFLEGWHFYPIGKTKGEPFDVTTQ